MEPRAGGQPINHELSVVGNGFSQKQFLGQPLTFTVSFSGLPNYVTKGTLDINVYITDMFGAPYSGEIRDVYFVNSAPVSPMEPVWAEVLDNACVWARGESSAGPIRAALTRGYYDSGRNVYNPAAYRYTQFSVSAGVPQLCRFYLQAFVDHDGEADCGTFNTYLATMACALGCSTNLRFAYANLEGQRVDFRTTTHKWCGGAVQYYTFAWHAIAESSLYYDSCGKQISPGGTYVFADGLELATYWQYVHSRKFFGLVQGYIWAGEFIGDYVSPELYTTPIELVPGLP